MSLREKVVEYANNNFKEKALDLVEKQISLFYDDTHVQHNKYNVGEDVQLKKGTLLHGIAGDIPNFDFIARNGLIGNDFTVNTPVRNKIKNSIGMWKIKENKSLSDYIKEYSGITLSYTIGKGEESETVSRLVPYHKFDEFSEKLNNNYDIWTYWGTQTKEVRFMPSLVSDKRQIAFILNMDSDYAKKLAGVDVWDSNIIDDEMLKQFVDDKYYDRFIKDRKNRDAVTTDRESAVVFGLPSKLIEGVLVGRKLENDKEALEHIKEKLPDVYICNLDGKVIVGNV